METVGLRKTKCLLYLDGAYSKHGYAPKQEILKKRDEFLEFMTAPEQMKTMFSQAMSRAIVTFCRTPNANYLDALSEAKDSMS